MDVNIIFGPPGTGKTTELMRILSEELKKVAPSDIAYVSFTKEGANQGKTRAIERFGFTDKDFPFFRTLHSMAFKELGMSRYKVIGKDQYKEFSDKMGMHFTGYYTEDLRHDDDMYLFFDEMYRNNPRSAQQFLSLMDANKLEYVRKNYVRFKRALDIMDFTDMVEQFVKQRMSVPVKVALIDEAQDLTTLQWKMVWTAFRHCERVYIAGDDDQAIYQWSGADVDYFLGIEGNVSILKHSYRLPDSVLRYAKRIARNISKRVDKDYEGVGNAGFVEEHNSLADIAINDTDTYMFLSRNNTFLNPIEEEIRTRALVYSRKGVQSVSKADYLSILSYEKARKEGVMSYQEIATLGSVLKKNFTLSSPWFDSFAWPQEKLSYMRDLIAKKVHFDDNRVTIGTIHSAKGAEADHVILLLDITKNVLTNLQNNPDAEHRVFYVGATRAKKSLHIVNSSSRYSYKGV